MEALGQVLLMVVVVAFAIAGTIKLRSKMREQQMYAGDYPPFGNEVVPEQDLVQPFAMMENNVARDENNKFLRLNEPVPQVISAQTGVRYMSSSIIDDSLPVLSNTLTDDPRDYRIKKLDSAKKTRAVVKKKVAPKKAKTATKSKRTTRKVRT